MFREFFTNFTDMYIGTLEAVGMPKVDEILEYEGKKYRVVDWSIGQRFIDELYVVEAK